MTNTPPTDESVETDIPPASFGRLLVLSLIVAGGLTAASAWTYHRIPPGTRVPIHWNAAGQADGFAGASAVFLMPAVVAGLSLLLFALPKFEPRRTHLLRSSRAYGWVWLTLIAFMGGLHVLTLRAALGLPVAMDKWVIGGVGVLFVIMGNFLGKIRSNFVFGFRTPWTLSSELSWSRTHRLAGWLFVVSGAALVTAVLLDVRGKPITFLLIGSVAAAVVVPTIYSYLVWRTDANRHSGPEAGKPLV